MVGTLRYDVLGFPEDTNPEDIPMKDIKKNYRKLSMKYHPDKNPNADATLKELYAQINNA
jgi:DnaJ-class molecular chaperone